MSGTRSIDSPICSSIYEDAPLNYLIDYSDIDGFARRSGAIMLSSWAWTRRARRFFTISIRPFPL